jgi:hypothetical protein
MFFCEYSWVPSPSISASRLHTYRHHFELLAPLWTPTYAWWKMLQELGVTGMTSGLEGKRHRFSVAECNTQLLNDISCIHMQILCIHTQIFCGGSFSSPLQADIPRAGCFLVNVSTSHPQRRINIKSLSKSTDLTTHFFSAFLEFIERRSTLRTPMVYNMLIRCDSHLQLFCLTGSNPTTQENGARSVRFVHEDLSPSEIE